MIGKLEKGLLDAVLEAIPVEISVVDAEDKVAGWNKHESRLFKRPLAARGMNVRQCHPKKSLAKVEQILQEMRAGKREKAEFWIDLPIGENRVKEKILIRYFALRDKKGKYLGCLEATQNISFMQKIRGEKRLLD
ncbi:MAG: PAS domain-containing protein [Candidatus Diapherotrites archaeon]|uniref:PAS domain-containing protein n=1 Tax=Candidatus Iainarchaeum sp. TaxID=3101447 RepID=A0A939C697_9ARCH|nr:PAS domain-containing protein [Candidatus Diapherotrites archaeon]